MSEAKDIRIISENEHKRLTLIRDGEIIGHYKVYDIETTLGIPNRLTIKADKNYRVDLCCLEPFGIEFEID